MQFVIETNDIISKEEGESLLRAFVATLTAEGHTVVAQELNEIDLTEIGDSNLIQEHFFESKIIRKIESKKKKDCRTEVCSVED
jgi:hypothetical protein